MPPSFTQCGINPATQTKLFVAELPSFQVLDHLDFPVKPGTIFIAADSREVTTDNIARVAERLLQQGLRYMCAWGPDCERVHDIFDEIYVGGGSSPHKFDMITTWHADESVGEAIWFFLNCAKVEEDEMIDRASFAVRIGNPAGSAPISELIRRIEEFTD